MYCLIIKSGHASTFQQGVDAVKQKNYQQAINYFTQVIDEGSESEKKISLTHFNLGVCYYRIEKYDRANEHFKQAMLSGILLWRSLFNLALVAEKQKSWEYASRLYKKIINSSNNPALIDLAEKKLQQLSQQLSLVPEANTNIDKQLLPLKWIGFVSSGFGQDSVVVGPQDIKSEDSDDTFYEIYTGLYRPLLVDDNSSLVFNTFLYSSNYDTTKDFDINLVNIGLEHRWQYHKKSYLSTGGAVEKSTLGDANYLLQYSLHLSNRWTLNSHAQLRMKYDYRQYQSLDPLFDSLQGERHKLQFTWSSPWFNNHRVKTEIFATNDNRDDYFDGIGYTYFSAYRKGVSAVWDYHQSHSQLIAGLEFRNSHYDGDNLLQDGSEMTREDNRIKVNVNWQYFFSSQWSLNLEYEYMKNHSNLDLYDYRGSITTTRVNFEF